ITFAYGVDAQNEFRKALLSTQDPDFYIVDRAGNLRYADVETASVEGAVNFLVDETADTAAAPKPETKPAENAAKPDDKPGDAGGGAPGNYQQPDASVYKAAHWPKAN